jgi:RHS repeat-associated protein
MKRRFFALLVFLFLVGLAGANALAQGTPAPTPEENPNGNAGALKAQIGTAGSYDAHSANGTRMVTDLHVPGALGDYGLDFTRYWNSTHNDLDDPNAEWPMDFGASGWSHSWHWNAEFITYSEPLHPMEDGGEEMFFTAIIITFPDGHTTKFKVTRSNRPHGIEPNVAHPDPRLGPYYTQPELEVAWPNGGLGVHDHICNMDVNGTDFWLCRADGGSVHFTGGSGNYRATAVFDPHGFRTDLLYNTNGDLYQIVQEGGRTLNLTWGTFPGNFHVITRVDTGGTAGSQYVTYQYSQVIGYFYVLAQVTYPDDPAPGQSSYAHYVYGTCYGDQAEPCDVTGQTAPMLKRADDPRYGGPMTKISYSYAGATCPVPTQPWLVPAWVAGQPYRIAAERSERNVVVSSFVLDCTSGERDEYNGLGGHRKFYFGNGANTFETAPPPDSYYGCRGYQLGKLTDFTTGAISTGLPCPVGVPCQRQNFFFDQPRHVWDGRNIMTNEIAVAADESGLPYQITHADGSNSFDDRLTLGNSLPLDTSRMHNPHNHWLFNKTDERGQYTTYTRDQRRRVTRIDYPDASFESFVYDNNDPNGLNQVTSHRLPSGGIETYVYHPATHLLMQEYNSVDPSGDRKEYTYDGLGRVLTMRDGRAIHDGAGYTVWMEYNGRHLVTKVHYRPAGGSSDPTVRYEYDNYGNCTAIIDELNHRKDYTYDVYRRCTSYTEQLDTPGWDGSGTVTSRRWDWFYDRVMDGGAAAVAASHTSKEWRVQVEPVFNSAGERRVTSRTFDVNNRITSEQTGWIQPYNQPLGNWHSGPDTEVHYFTYDENGQKKTYTDPLNRLTTYDYDNRNRVAITTEYPVPGASSTPHVTQTYYNTTGDKTLVIFPDGNTQQWPDSNYTAFGQPRVFIDERGDTTNMEYWPWGPMKKLATVTTHRLRDAASGGGTEDQLTKFYYDSMGRPQSTYFPDNSLEYTGYEFGQVNVWQTRRGAIKTIGYDARGREIWHTWNDGMTSGVSRGWDDASRLLSISNNISAIDYSYDSAGQVLVEGSTVVGSAGTGSSSVRKQVSYCRHPSGEVSRLVYPNGSTVVHRNYTARGQLNDVGWDVGSTSYVYLPDGKVNYQARSNGVTTTFGYDGRGMIGSLSHNNSAGQNLAYREYWRDNRDRITAWKRGVDHAQNGMETGRGDRYVYDQEGQLTTASYLALTPQDTPTEVTRTEIFHYDELGNRMGANYLATRGTVNFTREDNGLNQYRSWYAPTNYDDDMGELWGSPGHANGVLMQEGYITASFNALNQPMAIWSPVYGTANLMWFGFDPLGRCVKRWVGPQTGTPPHAPPPDTNPATYYYYDGWDLVQEGPSASIADKLYVHGGRVDEIVASQLGGQWYHHHYDASGHCIMLTDTGGTIQEQYEYDAFGVPYFHNRDGSKRGATLQLGNRFLFTGREWLKDLKIYDFRNRQYQPELGRFLQPDPKEFAAGDYNIYRYCHNDPVNKTDPLGLAPGDPFDSIEDAARDVHSFINPTSIRQNAEYGSVIYRVGDHFFASPTFTNGSGTKVVVGAPSDKSRIPEGVRQSATRVGDYHDHGDYSKKITNPTNGRSTIVRTSKSEDPKSDHPSEPDRSRAESIQKTNPEYRFFLGTPSKELKEYDSKKEKPL